MHREAELGFASHWHYKETSTGLSRSKGEAQDQDRIDYVRQLIAWKQDLSHDNKAISKASKAIYVLTPQGKVLELPQEATPIDFAYLLHTDLGHRCRGAKIDGVMVTLNTSLRSGQTVEILAARASDQLGPSRDWLNPSLGYVKSSRAKTKVRQWFHALDEQRDLAIGRAKLEKLLQREGKTALAHEELANRMGFEGVKALFLSLAREELSSRALENAVRFDAYQALPADSKHPPTLLEAQSSLSAAQFRATAKAVKPSAAGQHSRILVDGVASLLHHLAGCCRPIPPDEISGFITRGEGVSVHRISCSTYGRLLNRHPERVIPVSWGADAGSDPSGRKSEQTGRGVRDSHDLPAFAAELLVRANDRQGLLRDLTELMSRLKVRMTSIRSYTKREQLNIRLTLELSHQRELSFVIKKLRELPGILLTSRIGD
jgi:GTP pyrophosphokinase